MSDSSQGSGAPPVKPALPKGAAASPRAPATPVRPKPPASPTAGIRPRAPSVADAVPEARRAREPLPDDATIPLRRSDHPPSMPADDSWDSSPPRERTEAAAAPLQLPVQQDSPNPPAVSGAVVTDATSLKNALEEVLGPMQRALDDLTVKIARERVDRKDAIERLEKVLQRVQTAPPPNVALAHAAPSPAPPPVAYSPPAAQPFAVSPSSRPPPVAPVAAAPKALSPVPPPVAMTPAPPPVPAAVAPAPAPAAPAIYRPSSVPPGELEGPSDLAVIEGPRRIEVPSYSTDLGIDLPPGLDGSRNKRRMLWLVALVVVGGALAMIISMILSRSRGPGAL